MSCFFFKNAEVVEWYTRRPQKSLGVISCGFDSRLRHHNHADMLEQVDSLVLETSGEIRGSSSLPIRTKFKRVSIQMVEGLRL